MARKVWIVWAKQAQKKKERKKLQERRKPWKAVHENRKVIGKIKKG